MKQFHSLVLCAAVASTHLTACGADLDDDSESIGAVQQAIPGINGVAWAFASSPSSAIGVPYTPPASGSYNSGNTIQVTRTAVGTYTVAFGGMQGDGGHVQAVAEGGGASRCKVGGWASNATALVATIVCHTPAGAPDNTAFVVTFFRESGTLYDPGAYLWANDEDSTYTPDAAYRWNSSGAVNTITYQGVGQYLAVLPNMVSPDDGGSVIVTAYGSEDADHCKLKRWVPSGADINVEVRCFDASGSTANNRFVLHYAASNFTNKEWGYLFANNATSASYTPLLGYQQVTDGATATAGKDATSYWATYPGLASAGSTAQITAWDNNFGLTSANYCKLLSWSGAEVRTSCFNAAGAPADSRYTQRYLTDDAIIP